jgi:hypothetical protein
MAEQDATAVAITGGTINNTTIGATTATTGKFTSVTTPSVTATTNDLTLSAISTGKVKFNTLGGLQAQVLDSSSAVNYVQLTGGATNVPVSMTSQGSDADIGFRISSFGAAALRLFTNNLATEQARVSHTASAVNYVQVTGSVTTSAPIISSQGSDTNIALSFVAKGNARHNFFNNSATSSRQFSIGTSGITGAVNFLNVDGSVAGIALPMQAQGTDTNISMAFQPKGTGAIDLAAGSSGVNISNGGTVTAITRTAVGVNYTTNPTVAISAPTTAGGVQATATVPIGVASFTVSNGGTGYAVGNVLTMVGGTFTVAGTCTVSAVSSGVITAVTATSTGTYTAAPTNPASVTGGAGTGATFTLNFGILSTFTITNAGSGYIEQPTITFSGGGGSGAAAYATVGSATIFRSLAGNGSSAQSLSFHSSSGESLRVTTSTTGGTSANFIQTAGGATGNGPRVTAEGSDSNIFLGLVTKGTGAFQFLTNLGTEQMRVSHTASAVNYVQVTGSVTGAASSALGGLSFTGSDASPNFAIGTKGTGYIAFYGQAATNVQSFRISNTNASSSGNLLQVQGAAAGSAPSISAISGTSGTDTDIDLSLTPKGTGLVRFGTYTGTILTPTGFIEIKDSGGTTRRLLVG